MKKLIKYLSRLFAAIFLTGCSAAQCRESKSGPIPNANFTIDPKVEEIAAAYTLDAIDLARDNFGITLDGTEESIKDVEKILDIMHKQMPEASPTQERIITVAKAFGSYVGEVYRKHHSAEWGISGAFGGEGEAVGLHDTKKNSTFWPWARVYHRLINGSEDNVWVYYIALTRSKD